MPHATLQIVDGVNTNRTPALNEAGISASQLIRYMPDSRGISVQKLGGWTRWFPNTQSAIPRALWAWEDTEGVSHLAIGTQNATNTFAAQINVITNGVQTSVTPRSQADNVTPTVSSTSGSSILTITDATITNITRYDAVYIPTHISIGGVVLFGLYACNPDGHSATTTYTVGAVDTLGAPLNATATTSAAAVAKFTTVSGSTEVTVTLNNHGYAVGNTYPVLVPTTVGGVTFFSHFPVQTVVDANNFTITGPTTATSSTNGYINGGNARFIYSFGIGSIPAGSGFGVGGFGRGGFGTGTGITPSLGYAVPANDWTLDNWGEQLVATPTADPIVLTATSASGTGVTGTLHFAETYTTPVGETIVVSGMVPNSWNGTYTVTGSTSTSVSFATAVTSALTTLGTILVEATPFQPIYVWDAEAGAPTAVAIPEAPPVNEGAFVAMPQRQIIAYGSTFTGLQDPLLIRWCDIDDYNVWIGQTVNQAGSYRLPRGSRIVGAMQVPLQALVWTDLGLWSMQYIGQPLVYSFSEIGTGCGLIAKKAAGALNGVVYWMGPSQFYVLTDAGVESLPCDVWDVVFQQIDTAHVSKIRAAVNSRFGEIAWYFPTTSSNGEVAMYVKYNVVVGKWDYGTLSRSAWVDQSVLGPPIGADPSSLYLYQHETSPDADGQAMTSAFTTGYFALGEGDWMTFVDQVWPDFKWGQYGGSMNATLQISFSVTGYPGQAATTIGPYSVTHGSTFINPRFRNRLVAITIGSSDVGSFWRIGAFRYRYAPDGKY